MFQGVILLDANGESCDGDASDVEEVVDHQSSNNFVFVGAEIRTGKSSIRSKPKTKKVSILNTCSQVRGFGFKTSFQSPELRAPPIGNV